MSVKRDVLYPVAERLPMEVVKFFTIRGSCIPTLGTTYQNIRAAWTGEKRCPLKGEYYLSGAIAEAYRAPNDLSTAYHIARLVQVEEVVIQKIVKVLAG